MIKTIIYSFKKSIRLKKISNILGFAAKYNTSELTENVATKDPEEREKKRERREKAEEELLAMCESDPYTIIIMKRYNADRETLRKAYAKLIYAGAGQWKKGHFIPASSLVYNQSLDYLLKNINKEGKDFTFVAWTLLKYFEKRKIGIIEE
jgi:hypothetical protein